MIVVLHVHYSNNLLKSELIQDFVQELGLGHGHGHGYGYGND